MRPTSLCLRVCERVYGFRTKKESREKVKVNEERARYKGGDKARERLRTVREQYVNRT